MKIIYDASYISAREYAEIIKQKMEVETQIKEESGKLLKQAIRQIITAIVLIGFATVALIAFSI